MSENNNDIKPKTAQYILKRLAEKQADDEPITEADISYDTKNYLIKTRRVEEVMYTVPGETLEIAVKYLVERLQNGRMTGEVDTISECIIEILPFTQEHIQTALSDTEREQCESLVATYGEDLTTSDYDTSYPEPKGEN